MILRAAFVVAFLVVAGCSRPESSSPPVIKVGVQDDGKPFFDWEGMMSFETNSRGLVHRASGAKAHASFSRPAWKSALEVDLTVKDTDDDHYAIAGTVTSPVPFRLELLGTAPTEKEIDQSLIFPAGTSKVSFEGKLHSTYAKKG
jgi:hypothetical protein